MIRLQRLSDPVTEPITVEQAREHLRNEDEAFDLEDPLIEALIGAARDYCEMYCNRSWASAEWRLTLDKVPRYGRICLSDPMTTAVDAVTYLDADDTEQTIPGTDYSYDSVRQLLIPGDAWPSDADTVVIDYTAGPDHSASPAPIMPKSVIMAMKLVLTDFYENRAGKTDVRLYENQAVMSLLTPYRVSMGI